MAAVVQLREGTAGPSLDDVQVRCRTRPAGYKFPRQLVIEDAPALAQRQGGQPVGAGVAVAADGRIPGPSD